MNIRLTDAQIEEGFEFIINRVSNGEPVRNCFDGIVKEKTFYKLIKNCENKSLQYARAREDRNDKIFEEILTIADANENDTYIDNNGVAKINNEIVQRSRIRIDSRKWMLSKMNPKKYGDKIDHTTDGEKIRNPTIIKWGENEIEV